MNGPIVSLQYTFFRSIGVGDLENMRKAYQEGADPHAPSPEKGLSAWLYASMYAPLSAMKDIFALLETWHVGRRGGPSDVSGSHPCIELMLRTYPDTTTTTQEKLRERQQAMHQGCTLAWDLWKTLDQQEQRRILLTLDVCAWAHSRPETYGSLNNEDMHLYTERMKHVWQTPPCLKAFHSEEFTSLSAALHASSSPLSAPSFSLTSPLTPLSEETLFWCLQGIQASLTPVGPGSAFTKSPFSRWGMNLLTAPDAVLKGCLESVPARRLIMQEIEKHSIISLRYPPSETLHYPEMYKAFVQRCHALGAPWPEAWPESLRTRLLEFPAIRRFEEQQLLTRVLEHTNATTKTETDLSSPRRRL